MATKRFVSKDNLGRVWTRLFGKVLNSKEEIEANKSENMIAGADAVKEVYSSLNGMKFGIDGDGNYGYYGADGSLIPFKSGFSGANIYMSGTNSGNLAKVENANIGQYFYGFGYDESTKKFTVLYDGTYSYMISTTSSYTSLYINDKQIAYSNPSSKTLYKTIELKKGDTGYIFSNASGQFAQGYMTRIS